MSVIEKQDRVIVSIDDVIMAKGEDAIIQTDYSEVTVVPTIALKNISLQSVPYVVQEAIDAAKLDAKDLALADGILTDIKDRLLLVEDEKTTKFYVDEQLTFLEELISQKATPEAVAAIIDTKVAIATEDFVSTAQVNGLTSRVDDSEASIANLAETINTKDSARATQINEVEARVNENLSNYSDVLDLTVDEEGNVKAEKIEELKITIADQQGEIDGFNKQIYGVVEYFDGIEAVVDNVTFAPKQNVMPYQSWYSTDIANGNDTERSKHTGDTYEQYELIDGKREYIASWKFLKTSLSYPNVDADGYCWSAITSSTALDAYKKAISAQQNVEAVEVALNETSTLLNTVQGWAANASKFITDAAGNLTGYEFADGSNTKSYFTYLADRFFFKTENGKKTPFSIDGDDILFNGKVSFSNTTNVPDFQTQSEVNSLIGTAKTELTQAYESYTEVYDSAVVDGKIDDAEAAAIAEAQNKVDVAKLALEEQINAIPTVADISWQEEVQSALDNNTTIIDGAKVVVNTALVNNLNALGGIVTDTIQLNSLTVLTDANKVSGFGTSVPSVTTSSSSLITLTFPKVRAYNDNSGLDAYRFKSYTSSNVVFFGNSSNYTLLGTFIRTGSATNGVIIEIRVGTTIIHSITKSYGYTTNNTEIITIGETLFKVVKRYTAAAGYAPATCHIDIAVSNNTSLSLTGDGEFNIRLVGVNQTTSVPYSPLLIHNNI